LKNFNGIIPQRLPRSLQNTLRPYQKAGYDWLHFLNQYSFGGCLADDMGLGKTLQALSLLMSEKEKGNSKPNLIICPTSVVFNWQQEVKKFTAGLTVYSHLGLERVRDVQEFNKYDIILTTYGIMRRDILFLKDFHFNYIILDESQKIKNPNSQTAKASRLLTGRHRLSLTGTPIENNTLELWSQFSFVNPGLLGNIHYFKRTFVTSIEKEQDDTTLNILRRLVYPFILRRTKEKVAMDLPPKTEQTVFCSMNSKQKNLYEQWRDYYRALLLDKISEQGIQKTRMNVLEGLIKLRQIACHPNLIEKKITEDSGKFQHFKEIVEEILSENHKVLVFSQFVRMLKIIKNYFDKNGIRYEYLDGHTINREKVVENFQKNKNIKIFLISLKAGGTGLNLTAADYVILYDPWWNPAVEIQAMDRAHRIGQNKNVFVYKLISKDTVEEKMLELQQRKKSLVDNLIVTDQRFFKSLTKEDIDILFS
jgi:non-specific serine/threonine protein kinase